MRKTHLRNTNKRRSFTRALAAARAGFTMLELQVAVILLAFGMITMASLLSTQQRTLKRLRGDFVPTSTIYVTRSVDPWQQKLGVPARITSTPLTQGAAPTPPFQLQTVTVLSVEPSLTNQSMTVTVDTALIP